MKKSGGVQSRRIQKRISFAWFCLLMARFSGLGDEGGDSAAKNVDNGRGERDEKESIREGFELASHG